MNSMLRDTVRRATMAGLLVVAASSVAMIPARAQQRGPRPGEVETDPIRCWWKTSTTEVRIGQRFLLTLTCGVIETRSVTVVANTNSLDPGALQVTPFEVVSGVRREDILSPPWRYFQYEYQVRLLGEGFFGQDIALPSVPVTYNVQAASGDGAQGRDLSYALPALPLRVASLVPRGAADIRDVSGAGFAGIEARRFRASTATVAGGILIGFAGVLGILAVVRVFGRVRTRQRVTHRAVSPLTTLGAALRALAQIKTAAARDGWTPALARQALTPLRLGAATALGRPVAQRPATSDTSLREGQMLVRDGRWRPRHVVVSAAATGGTVAKALKDAPVSPPRRAALERLGAALQTFTTAAYGRATELDTIALDRALGDGTEAIRQLRLRGLIPAGRTPAGKPPVTGLSPSMSGDRA